MADGRQATVLTSKVPLTDRTGEVVGLLGIFTDISERKQAEGALKKSEQDYRQLYRQFQGLLNAIPDTIMLIAPDLTIVWANRGAMNQFPACASLHKRYCFNAWQGLNQPCAGCTEADRNSRLASLGELAAGVAHEINNPNGLILLNTPMLRDVLHDALSLFEDHYQQHGMLELGGLDYQELRDELPVMLQRIEGGAQRIKRIVEDLKNFVRQGDIDLSGQLDLNEVVQTAIRLLDNSIKKATDHFETAFGALPLGQGDFQRIEQVVINLIQNACQALTDRSAKIQLITYFDAENNCNILQLHDGGAGIAPEILPHVTDPFYTTRRQSGGTGLGLSISARIIREHGGQLELQSTLGVGTVVTMKLPIAEERECA
jgi:signal transduction histidine kinase